MASDQMPRRGFPCNECPVRRDNADNPRSKFPAECWQSLRASIGSPASPEEYLRQPLFACHKGAPSTGEDLTCAGWLAVFGADSVKVRMAVTTGRLDPAALVPGPDWPALYSSWDEMAAAQLWSPGDSAEHLPEPLRSRCDFKSETGALTAKGNAGD